MATIKLGRGMRLRLLVLTTDWQKHHPSRPHLFTEEWNRACTHLETLPLGTPRSPLPKVPDARAILLRECQYHVYYVYRPAPLDRVLIVAIRGCRQKPL